MAAVPSPPANADRSVTTLVDAEQLRCPGQQGTYISVAHEMRGQPIKDRTGTHSEHSNGRAVQTFGDEIEFGRCQVVVGKSLDCSNDKRRGVGPLADQCVET